MSNTASERISTPSEHRRLTKRTLARGHVHDAEMALHDANQTHVDSWVRAAADRLHEAIQELIAADTALRLPWAAA